MGRAGKDDSPVLRDARGTGDIKIFEENLAYCDDKSSATAKEAKSC
jgi:hypothetical protein